MASSSDENADRAAGIVFIAPFWCIRWLLLLILRLPGHLLPVLLEPCQRILFRLVLLLRRQKALDFISSLPIHDHGIRIHVSFPYRTWAKHNLILVRIGILLLNLFIALLYANSHLSEVSDSWPAVDWSPRQRLDSTVCHLYYKLHWHAPPAVFLIFH